MRSDDSESGPDSPGTDAATAGSPRHTAFDGSARGSPSGLFNPLPNDQTSFVYYCITERKMWNLRSCPCCRYWSFV